VNEDLIEGEMDNTEYLLSSNKMKERLLAARESDVGTAIKGPDIYPTWRVLLICGSSGSGKTTLGRHLAERFGVSLLLIGSWRFGRYLVEQAAIADVPVVPSRPFETLAERLMPEIL
jgi:type II secretory pathway predicted ATPase ExeA